MAKLICPPSMMPMALVGCFQMLDGNPDTYWLWASEYFECDISRAAIEAVYQHQPLSDELIVALNPHQSKNLLAPDIAEIGYAV